MCRSVSVSISVQVERLMEISNARSAEMRRHRHKSTLPTRDTVGQAVTAAKEDRNETLSSGDYTARIRNIQVAELLSRANSN